MFEWVIALVTSLYVRKVCFKTNVKAPVLNKYLSDADINLIPRKVELASGLSR